MIREEQHQALTERGINVSGLVRDLIDDHLSDYRVTISVSEETRRIYDQVVANTGSSDQVLERYFRASLVAMLNDRIKEMQALAAAAKATT